MDADVEVQSKSNKQSIHLKGIEILKMSRVGLVKIIILIPYLNPVRIWYRSLNGNNNTFFDEYKVILKVYSQRKYDFLSWNL